MRRRRYLTAVTSIGGVGLGGCADLRSWNDDASTPTLDDDSTLAAGEYTVTLSDPRVRPSIRTGGVHLDVHDELETQFLVFAISTDGTQLEELPLSLRTGGSAVDAPPTLVGRPETEFGAEGAFAVPHGSYEAAEVVLEADGETDNWSVPSDCLLALGSAPDFVVDSLDVPETIPDVRPFQATFTVSNGGGRGARFLTEFWHGLISDTSEVELTVPPGAQRTHTRQIEPPDGDYESIPVVLDWGLGRREVEVAVE